MTWQADQDIPLMDTSFAKWQRGMYDSFKYKPEDLKYANLLGGNLMNIASGDNPYLKNLASLVSGQIGRKTKSAIEETNQSLANTGLGRAGVGLAAKSKIYEGESMALSNMTGALGQLDMDWRTNAIGKLLGIDTMNMQGKQGNAQIWNDQMRNVLGYGGYMNQAQQIANEEDAGLWQFISSIISAGAKIGSAALGAP